MSDSIFEQWINTWKSYGFEPWTKYAKITSDYWSEVGHNNFQVANEAYQFCSEAQSQNMSNVKSFEDIRSAGTNTFFKFAPNVTKYYQKSFDTWMKNASAYQAWIAEYYQK